MALVPTVRMKRNTAVITVNESEVEAWKKAGYEVYDAEAEAKAKAEAEAKAKAKK